MLAATPEERALGSAKHLEAVLQMSLRLEQRKPHASIKANQNR